VVLIAYSIVSDRLLINGFLAQYGCQAFIAFVVALLMCRPHQGSRRAVMAYWGFASASQGIYLICAAMSLWCIGLGGPSDSLLRFALGVVSLFAAGMQFYCMLWGWLSLDSGKSLKGRHLFRIALSIAAGALALALIVHQPMFDGDLRSKVKVCVCSMILGLIYLYIAVAAFRRRRLNRTVRYWLSGSLLLVGLRYVSFGLKVWVDQGPATYELEFYMQFLDIALQVFVGAGMMLWVTTDHFDRLMAQKKELKHRAVLLSEQDRRLNQKQRLESIGRVSSGIAHDFNNLLTVILGWTGIMREESKMDATTEEAVDGIASAAKQAGSMTQQLLLYGGKQVLHPTLEDPAGLVKEVGSMARSLEDRKLIVEIGDGLPLVRVDKTYLLAALQNLLVNAIDATTRGDQIRMSAVAASIQSDPKSSHGLADGDYLKVTVSDEGVGICAEHLSKIFEPFFSTKDLGNGLGLASAHGFARQSGGLLDVESTLGKGTTFTMWLPEAAVTDQAPELEITEVKIVPIVRPSHNHTIALVDDQPEIVRYVQRALEQAGYNVVCGHSAEECLDAVLSLREAPTMLITDIMMPKVSGTQLAWKMRERYPNIGVIFMSGFSDSMALHDFGGGLKPVLLQKPLRMESLLRAVADHCQSTSGINETA
jgi:signal transduction histidine kinase/CheY-like chemotaxis protein